MVSCSNLAKPCAQSDTRSIVKFEQFPIDLSCDKICWITHEVKTAVSQCLFFKSTLFICFQNQRRCFFSRSVFSFFGGGGGGGFGVSGLRS